MLSVRQRLNAKVSDSGAECLTDTQSKPWTPKLWGPDLTGSTLQILSFITVESASPSNSAERMLTLGFSWTFFFFYGNISMGKVKLQVSKSIKDLKIILNSSIGFVNYL